MRFYPQKIKPFFSIRVLPNRPDQSGCHQYRGDGQRRRPIGASTITQQVAGKNFLLTNELRPQDVAILLSAWNALFPKNRYSPLSERDLSGIWQRRGPLRAELF